MSSLSPKVTVLMSAYNAGRHVAQAVCSILNQTMSDFELIIFEDGSHDNTREVLAGFSDDRIRLIVNETNAGLTANLAQGVRLARGEYIARMDADDISEPDRLLRQLAHMESRPDIGVLGSAVVYFDETGWEFLATQPSGHDAIKCELLFGYTLLHPTVMMRVDILRRHGLNYDVAFRVSQDHDLWARLAKVTRLENLREPLVRMREHPGKISRNHGGSQKGFSDEVRQRQLAEIGVVLVGADAVAFHRACAGSPLPDWRDVARLDRTLQRILIANASTTAYNATSIAYASCRLLREVCRRELVDGRWSGSYYWISQGFWKYGLTQPVKQAMGMVARTLLAPFVTRGRG